MGTLDGRVVIVTGGARGQGEAEVRHLVAAGAQVVFGDVLEDEGTALAGELGDAATFLRHDVTAPDDWASVVAAATERGPLRGLINNAAIHWIRPLIDEDVDDLRRLLDVNLVGTFLGIQSVAGPMSDAGGGAIVNISSIAGLTGLPGHGAYGASKWGVRGLSRTAAVELGPLGIRVNSIHPGPIESPMLPAERRGRPEMFQHLPLQRAGLAEEVADLALYLLSDASSYQTGSEYVVDGGSMAGPAPRGE